MKKLLLLCITAVMLSGLLLAQGVTTGSFSGQVLTSDGNALPGAQIVAVHQPTGTKYTAVTVGNGQFFIPAVRVGGPYTVTVSAENFKTETQADLAVRLGETKFVQFTLQLATVDMGSITVTASSPVINPYRTGASQNVSQDVIENLPTISRSLSDFTRMAPQVLNNEETDGAFNAGGRSSRYNNVQIDGAQSNDLFGLGSTGTPGGQSEATLISLDAVQEFQVVLAPYDVRQGMFTGGGVNIITKSGRNKLFGSLFFEGRNESLVGKGPDSYKFNKFTDGVFGGSVGGAIIKDKLFFFLNGEVDNRKTPQDYFIDGSGSQYDWGNLAEAERFVSILQTKYGYDPGTYDQITAKKKKMNIFGRIDWNINASNRLTLRTSYLSSDLDSILRNSRTGFNFGNNGVIYQTQQHSTVLQLDSVLSKNLSNQLILNYQRVYDNPIYMGAAFPYISVSIGGGKTFYAGAEQYRHINELKQDLIEITDSLTLFKGNHTLVFGTHNELFHFYNAYVQRAFGLYSFSSLDNLEAGKADSYDRYYSLTGDPKAPAKFWVFQLGLYAMDEWNVTPDLKLTLGLRADVPVMPDSPLANPAVETTFGYSTDKVATGNILFSPRLGFNFQPGGTRDLQIRGGIGIFSGRTPYVWISNQFSNTGMDLGRYYLSRGPVPHGFIADPNAQPTNPNPYAYDGDINIMGEDYRFPQLLRTSLAVDKKLPLGFTGTLEFVYSKNIKDIWYSNINILPTGASNVFDGRPLFGTQSVSGSGSARYGRANYKSTSFKNVILLSNTNLGYQWNLSLQLQREWGRGNTVNIAYSFGRAKDANSGTSSRAISNFQYNMTQGNPNQAALGYSLFDPGHRIMVAASKRFSFFHNAPTTLSIFYNGHSGSRYSTIFYNDVNGDSFANDLMWVPESADQIILTRGTWDQLDAYIKNDPGLEKYRGQILPRHSSREKWYNGFDLRLAQQLPVGFAAGHRVEIYMSMKNVLNLLNRDWGVFRYMNNEDAPLTFMGYDSATGKPKFEFYGKTDPENPNNKDYRFLINQLLSRWQMLVGVKYAF